MRRGEARRGVDGWVMRFAGWGCGMPVDSIGIVTGRRESCLTAAWEKASRMSLYCLGLLLMRTQAGRSGEVSR